MRITGLGHASLFIETAHGSILTDPWVNPAYFASWFPFPDNSQLDWQRYGQADYLFVSHLHHDHFDPANLREVVSKSITVLLPEFPTSELEDALRALGFQSIVKIPSGIPVEIDGLQVMIQSVISPTDGPMGDSSLWVYDGQQRLLNQNDARPSELTVFTELGPIDSYLVQFSGAIWYPMVYDLPSRAKQALGSRKRQRQFDRTMRYIEACQARFVFPVAGPPCFLDEELWGLNDIFGDSANIFPDQVVYLDWMQKQGHGEGRLLLPGTIANVDAPDCPVVHPYDPATIYASNETKTAYLREMQVRRMPEVEALKSTWPHPELNVLVSLKEWFEPLLKAADHICEGINDRVRLTCEDGVRGNVDVLIDFVSREVRAYGGEKVRYAFRSRRSYIEHLIFVRETDWVNSLFLSCRFSAYRIGRYNEYVYVFFGCLSMERLARAERWFADRAVIETVDTIVMDGWEIQKRCPHLQADLSKFGTVEGQADGAAVLTCQMHGWRWRLADGKCLSSTGENLWAAPAARSSA